MLLKLFNPLIDCVSITLVLLPFVKYTVGVIEKERYTQNKQESLDVKKDEVSIFLFVRVLSKFENT